MSADPRKGCIYMKYPRFWREAKGAPAPRPSGQQVDPEQRTYCYSPKGDADSFVKFFAGEKVKKDDRD